MEQNNAAVHVQQLRLQRSDYKLGPIDLSIPRGYVTAIVGPNGSGKSTLFRMMLDLVKPDAGTIQLLGQQVGAQEDMMLKRRIGYLAENPASGENDMTGAFKTDFVRFWYPGWDQSYYAELLRLFEINDNKKLGKMSKGMRRKYDLALALAHKPELLLLDEPSSGLDPLAWRTMLETLHRFMDEGERTIIMASHVLEEVKRLADYIVFMASGQILGMYEKDELLGSWQVMFVNGADSSLSLMSAIPGLCEYEPAGNGCRIVTKDAFHAERWLTEKGMAVTHRQPMELDDILAALMKEKETKGKNLK